MISNYDSHGKNVSLYFDKQNARFTPAYDLVNVAMFPQFKHVLAMAMGDEFEPQDIHAYQLADFAETCEIDKKLLSRQLIGLANKVLSQLKGHELFEQLKQQPYIGPEDIRYCEMLRDHIIDRTEHLKAQVADIPALSV